MSQKLDLASVEIGDNFIQPFQFLDVADAPIPQAGLTYDFSLDLDPRKLGTEAELYDEIVVPDDSVAAEGIVVVSFSFTETQDLKPAKYHYKLRRIFPETQGEEKRIITLFDGFIQFEY